MSSFAIASPLHTHSVATKLDLPTPIQNASWQGRLYTWSVEKIKALSKCIQNLAYAIFYPLNLIFDNTLATSLLCKKLHQNVLPMTVQLQGLPNHHPKLSRVLDSSFTIINTLQIAEDVDFFFNGKFKDHSLTGIAAKIMVAASHVLQGLVWLAKAGLASALPLGGLRIITLAANGRLVDAVNATFAVASALFVADAFSKLPTAASEVRKKGLILDVVSHVGELALSLMMLAGRMSVVSLGVMGVVCIGLGTINLIYKERYGNTVP